jgi:Tfp pilus assembly protein PilV
MTLTPPHYRRRHGSSLIEAIIAVGVLAVVIPLVFGTLAESGKSGLASQAETRSTWIVPACMDEIRASREGRPQYFTATVAGQAFPPADQVWALAFSMDGAPLGKISKALYDSGTRELDGNPVRYIAKMSASAVTADPGRDPMQRVDISLEYPASQNAGKRSKLEFHTHIP